MPTWYALNLTVDLARAQDGQVAPPGPTSRRWARTTDEANWVLDLWSDPQNGVEAGPNLVQGDNFQIGVFYQNLPASKTISECTIIATFANKTAVGVTSPFRNDNNTVRAVLGLGTPAGLVATASPAYQIGPYPINVTGVRDARRLIRFEFTVAIKFKFSDNTEAEFSYDPEMDVTVDN